MFYLKGEVGWLYSEIMENLLKGQEKGIKCRMSGRWAIVCENFLLMEQLYDFEAISRGVPIKMVPPFADCGIHGMPNMSIHALIYRGKSDARNNSRMCLKILFIRGCKKCEESWGQFPASGL